MQSVPELSFGTLALANISGHLSLRSLRPVLPWHVVAMVAQMFGFSYLKASTHRV